MDQTETLQQAIDFARAGNISLAARLLARYVTTDSKSDTAWVWLAACLDDPDKRDYCLKKALEINPNSPANADALEEYLSAQIGHTTPKAQPIELPAPEVPVVVVDTPADVHPAAATGMSRNQKTILAVLVAAIIIVLAAMAYFVFVADPGLLQSLFGG